MYQLNIDAYSDAMDVRCDPNNEYNFDHTNAYKCEELISKFYKFLLTYSETIKNMYESSHDVVQWSEGWAIEDLYYRITDENFSIDKVRNMCYQQYARIANKAVTGSILFSTQLHNKIISQYKAGGIVTCAHHAPDLYSFLQADMRNTEYRNYLNYNLNYHYALITVEKGYYYDYICELRSIKHDIDKSSFIDHSHETEIEIFPRLFPNCVQFDWKVLFIDQDEDLWEELFAYFGKTHIWNEYKDTILKNISEYTIENNLIIDNHIHCMIR